MIDGELPVGAPEALADLRTARGACPPADALVRYEGLPEADRARAPEHDHIQICSRCQLVLLHLQEPDSVPAARSASPVARWALPIAALTLLALGLTIFQSRQAPQVDSVRGAELQPIGPAGTVLGPPILRWQSPLGGVRYRVTVRRGTTVIWVGTVEATEVAIPDSVALEPGAEYSWQVEAIDKEGEVRMTSPSQTFTIS